MKKILIVDDDGDTLAGLQVLLAAHLFDTVYARDGVMAVRAMREHQPDLVLLDLGLPAGSGYDVLEWCKGDAALAAVPVVVLSAWEASVNMDRALAAGAAAYLQKPWNDDELLALIKQLVRSEE